MAAGYVPAADASVSMTELALQSQGVMHFCPQVVQQSDGGKVPLGAALRGVWKKV
jgi:hypothetical protein